MPETEIESPRCRASKKGSGQPPPAGATAIADCSRCLAGTILEMKAMLLIGCLLLAACGTKEVLVTDDAAAGAFCAAVLPTLEAVDAENPNTARSAAVDVSTAAQQLAPADRAELTAKSTTLQAEVTAGVGWSTNDIVLIVNRVCKSEIVGVTAVGTVGAEYGGLSGE